jgi:indoleamine 2,3-dioxygenase
LANYRLLDPSKGLEYDNIALIRAFEHGLDRTSSEAGFVLVHVDMVRHSGGLVRGVLKALQGVESDDRVLFDDGLEETLDALRKVNKTMDSACAYIHRTFPILT